MCAGADAASSSTASAGCGHYFCAGCVTEYTRGAVRDRKFPVPCPMGAAAGGTGRCGIKLSRDTVLVLLEGHPEDAQVFRQLEAESVLDPARTIYCPHKACSSPMMRPDDLPPDQPSACPACHKAFCPRCLVSGWHQGYTCAQFQQLPAHLRSAEDAAVLQFSARQQWKRCPQCGNMVERSEGCNHVLCRCRCNFCYACGKQYSNAKPTVDNMHGTPACACQLFTVPGDDDDDDDDDGDDDDDDDGDDDDGDGHAGPAAVAPAPAVGRAEAAWLRLPAPCRGGQQVRRRHCRNSASILDCPYGKRCWYWHDEDGPL